MASLKGKHILLGVTGSIAAYKSAMLIRALVKEGAEVRVVMTEMAKHFITPLTLATLSKNPIAVEFYNPENGDWNSHVSLGLWADLMLIAPVTANTMGKMVTGVADNLLITSYLSAKCYGFRIFLPPYRRPIRGHTHRYRRTYTAPLPDLQSLHRSAGRTDV